MLAQAISDPEKRTVAILALSTSITVLSVDELLSPAHPGLPFRM